MEKKGEMLKKIVMISSKDILKTIENLKKNIYDMTGKNFKLIPADSSKDPKLIENVNRLCLNLVARFGEERLWGWHFAATIEDIKELANMDPKDIVLVKAPPANSGIYGYEPIAEDARAAIVNINENIEIHTIADADQLTPTEDDVQDMMIEAYEDPFTRYQRLNCTNKFWNFVKLTAWLFMLCMLGYIVFSSTIPRKPKLIQVHPLNPLEDFGAKNRTNSTDYVWKLELHNDANVSIKSIPKRILNNGNVLSFMMEWKEFLLVIVIFYIMSYYLHLALTHE